MELIETLRWNLDFIREETGKVDSAPEVKKRVLAVCEKVASVIDRVEKDNDVDVFLNGMKDGFRLFDDIIQDLEENDREQIMQMLLMTHVADMIVAVNPPKKTR